MFLGSGTAAYLSSQSRSARDDPAEKPRSAGSLTGCAGRSRQAKHTTTRAPAYFIGSIRILAQEFAGDDSRVITVSPGSAVSLPAGESDPVMKRNARENHYLSKSGSEEGQHV